MLKMILATDLNNGIGYNNQLLCHIKEDMVRFKHLTIGSSVIMGSKTLLSLPKSQPLKDRTNIVITSKIDEYKEKYKDFYNIIFENNIMKLVDMFSGRYNDKHAWVIGGASIYKQFEPYCDIIELTKILDEFPKADTFFDIDINKWRLCNRGIIHESEEEPHYRYRFETFVRK